MYKIVEISPSKFKLYRKGWFFWRALMQDSGYAGETYMVYNTLAQAERALVEYVNGKNAEDDVQESFKHRPHIHLYGEDGYPKRVFKESNPGY